MTAKASDSRVVVLVGRSKTRQASTRVVVCLRLGSVLSMTRWYIKEGSEVVGTSSEVEGHTTVVKGGWSVRGSVEAGLHT